MPKELDILIQCLQANLDIINRCKDSLNSNEQVKVLYPVIVELKNLCDTCIPILKKNS
jgi:rRNA-processing protein FCF1